MTPSAPLCRSASPTAASFDDIWLMRATPEEALTRAEERIQEKLDTEIDRWNRRGLDFTE